MKTVEVIVEHAGKNLSAYIEGAPVIAVGNDRSIYFSSPVMSIRMMVR